MVPTWFFLLLCIENIAAWGRDVYMCVCVYTHTYTAIYIWLPVFGPPYNKDASLWNSKLYTFSITEIQVCAPISNAEEAEWFYEDLQDLRELTPPKDVLFMIGNWNAKVGIQEMPRVIGKFALEVQNETGQRLTQFCQEDTLVIANTLFQQQKRRLYTWTSPDGQHQNQIDYILCSQRGRNSIQSAKNKTGSWLWLRSWTPYCHSQTYVEESRQNH